MRRHLGLMVCAIACLLTTGASAQEYYTIEQVREQAALGWHETYEAYGREISVDVDPYVPDVDKVPLERLEFARMEPLVTEEETGLKFTVYPESNVFLVDSEIYNKEHTSGNDSMKSEDWMGYPNEWDRVYPPSSTLTLSEAIKVARETLPIVQLDEKNWDWEHPYELRTFSLRDPKTKEPAGEYWINFHQLVNGIPLLNHAGATFQKRTMGDSMICLRATVIDRDTYSISIDMLKSAGRVAEDVPLCSFSKVVEAFEKEIEEGHIRKVYEMEFGYLFYEDPEYVSSDTWTDHFYALPVWQLNCLYVSNRQKELPEYGLDETGHERASLEYSSLIVNAQTGELQDFMSTKKDRTHYKGFVSWDDVK